MSQSQKELAFSRPGTEMEAKSEEVCYSCLLKKHTLTYYGYRFFLAQIFEILHLTLTSNFSLISSETVLATIIS